MTNCSCWMPARFLVTWTCSAWKISPPRSSAPSASSTPASAWGWTALHSTLSRRSEGHYDGPMPAATARVLPASDALPPAESLLPEGFTPAARRALAKADPKLGALMKQVGPFRLKTAALRSPFMALAESIVYQQLTGKAAATIFGRVCERVGTGKRFTPNAVLAQSVESLREAGLSGAKTAALRDLAAKALEGEVPTLARARRMSDAALVEHLTKVRGIGQWTVEMLLI